MSMYAVVIDSPLGLMQIEADDQALLAVRFADARAHAHAGNAVTALAAEELAEYFAGTRHEFSVLLAPRGTPFQQRVWSALGDIPYGRTTTYQQIAIGLDQPQGAQAVGLANGSNPIAVIIPCHRVIAADGKLTGYAGGLERKAWLLRHEGALLV